MACNSPTLADTWAPHMFLFCCGEVDSGADFHARMFAPALGIPEDPATGAAAAAFVGYLWHRAAGAGPWIISQGSEIGRPSRIQAEAMVAAGALAAVRVGGTAVRVSYGQFLLP